MRAPRLLLVLTTLTPLLTACAERQQIAPLATARPANSAQSQPERRAEINRQLAARCPTPGNLTSPEMIAAADDLEKRAVGPHWVRMASEYDRMDDESKACRTGGGAK